MIQQTFNDIYSIELADGAIINDRHTGHMNDYLILHCLLQKYKPKTFFEIGTNTGFGTLIIKNALGYDSVVYSLDLPAIDAHLSNQSPISEGKGDCVGYECKLPYYQIFGDSRIYDYTLAPAEGYFVDSDHIYENVFFETKAILKVKPKIIIYHDADVNEVYNAIVDAMKDEAYDLFRVVDTRIVYALKKEMNENA